MSEYLLIQDVDDVEKIVKKSNYLVRSYYDLSTTEQKILLIAIAYIKDPECRVVDIPLPSYKKMLNIKDVNYTHFNTILKNLRQNTIVMATIDKNTNEVKEGIITGWVNSIYLKDGYISIHFNVDIWDHLVNLKKEYTEYQLSNVLLLTSKYSIRLFEIFKSHVWKKEYLVKIEELRTLLFVEDKYKGYYDFNKFVLEPAIKEINSIESIDFKVSYSPIKNGVKYDLVRFILEKEAEENEDSYIPPEVQMARSMSEQELFSSIRTILTMKYRVMFSPSDAVWSNYELYSRYALENTYLSLMEDKWKDHNITSPKAFFAEHLRRLSE